MSNGLRIDFRQATENILVLQTSSSTVGFDLRFGLPRMLWPSTHNDPVAPAAPAAAAG